MEKIIVVTIKEWNIKNFQKLKSQYENRYEFYLITKKEDLTMELILELNPKYIFFPHWSWIIPANIYENYECIVFHMTDLPFGRGGSPLQNLIIRGIYDTKISALRVTKELDAGDIYLKEPYNISNGSAEEIFINISDKIFFDMIPKIITQNLKPTPQKGKIVKFNRRDKKQSDLKSANINSLKKMYDYIRMLDAEGYPKAFLKLNNLKIDFSEVHIKNGKLVGRFEVTEDE